MDNDLTLSAIVAMSENRVIGKNNQLPWHLPADLKHFKSITSGHPIIMGRKTYESIGKPLPHRQNIILTRNLSFKAPGCLTAVSLEEALSQMDEKVKEIFVIGGAEIYQQLLPDIERIYLTLVHCTCDGDTFFPVIDMQTWKQISSEHHSADSSNPHPYSFLTLEKMPPLSILR